MSTLMTPVAQGYRQSIVDLTKDLRSANLIMDLVADLRVDTQSLCQLTEVLSFLF